MKSLNGAHNPSWLSLTYTSLPMLLSILYPLSFALINMCWIDHRASNKKVAAGLGPAWASAIDPKNSVNWELNKFSPLFGYENPPDAVKMTAEFLVGKLADIQRKAAYEFRFKGNTYAKGGL
ncbi:hypothetical protein HKD37_18G049455 [Glycine soja]